MPRHNPKTAIALLSAALIGLTSTPAHAAAAREAGTGFPSGLQTTGPCVTAAQVASFDTAFIAANVTPATRALILKTFAGSKALYFTDNPDEANLLIQITEGTGISDLNLWAVPNSGQGVKCDVMPNTKPTAAALVKDLNDYITALQIMNNGRAGHPPRIAKGSSAASKQPGSTMAAAMAKSTVVRAPIDPNSGFPDIGIGGRYTNKILCDSFLSKGDIDGFTNIFIARNAHPQMRTIVENAITGTPKYRIVQDSLTADFLIELDKREAINVERSRTPKVVIAGGGSTNGDEPWSNGEASQSEPVLAGGDIVETRTKFDVSDFTVYGVKHPAQTNDQGIICGLYYQVESKARGLRGVTTKDPAKKLTQRLASFFQDPTFDYNAKLYPPEARARMRELGQ
jgi:hypothetical protein